MKDESLLSPKEIYYILDPDIAKFDFSYFVPQHAMKPFRVEATHELVSSLGLLPHMHVLCPPRMTMQDITLFHDRQYFLNLLEYNAHSWNWCPDSSVRFSGDCPPIEGVLDYSCAIAAGSVCGAVLINAHVADVVIHWAGGMHHAKCGECSGFCYINDIVLAILELLRHHDRVLYLDLDAHHGDGVEEAFYTTNRVFTLSLHKFGEMFYPGTGSPLDVGVGDGEHCSLNLALPDAITDVHYIEIFEFALRHVMDVFQPQCVVLQCGADSLAGDRVGTFNLSSIGHGCCVEMVMRLQLPTLVLGGGGYNVSNVAKLWAYETSIICGVPLPPHTPLPLDLRCDWIFFPTSTIHVPPLLHGAAATLGVNQVVGAAKSQILRHCDLLKRKKMEEEVTREAQVVTLQQPIKEEAT